MLKIAMPGNCCIVIDLTCYSVYQNSFIVIILISRDITAIQYFITYIQRQLAYMLQKET